MFQLTTKSNIVGKPEITKLPFLLSQNSGPYEVWEFEGMADLREYAYIEGRAYTHGVVDIGQHSRDQSAEVATTRTPRSYDYFLHADLISIDIDKPTTSEHTLEYILRQEWASQVGLVYPSSSYTPEVPRWHLVYRLSERITDKDEYAALALAFYRQINLTVDERLMSAIQLSFGTVFRDDRISGKPLDLTYVSESAVLDVDWVRSLESYQQPQPLSDEYVDDLVKIQEYTRSPGSSFRAEVHHSQSPQVREQVVISALKALLPTLDGGVDYDLWLQIWTAAYEGSPTQAVFEYIVNHPNIAWSDGERGRAKFLYNWRNHTPKPDGYTVASLFWLAEQRAGWLRTSPYDVDDSQWELINVSRITDWTEQEPEIPKRVVMHAQTGLGKSMNVVHILQTLGDPKAVLFVPTKKLAAELTTTLVKNGIEATLYFNPQTQQIKSADVLRSAQVLVTTLQTFATKVYAEGCMAEYAVVYVEESDQLLAQFSLAGGVTYTSHISQKQSEAGFSVLTEACEMSGHVWFVDATMTAVSVEAARDMCPADKPARLIRNKYQKPKAPVTFLESRQQAFDLAVTTLIDKKRLVVATDTKSAASEFYQLLVNLGMDVFSNILLITKDTETDPKVIAFMEDVNTEALKYDVVIYNSVMASGVSITSVEPDVVIQVAEYLSPRANLQILNRYRKQKKVYCWYPQSFRVYGKRHLDLLELARDRVQAEQQVLQLPGRDRSRLAHLRAYLAAIAEADYYHQTRSGHTFYRNLLWKDGRRTETLSGLSMFDGIEALLEELHEVRKHNKDEIRRGWRSVRPINHHMPADGDMTLLDIAKGVEHEYILSTLNQYIPDIDQEHVYDVVHRFGPKRTSLLFFANQPQALAQSEANLSNTSVPETAIHSNVTNLTLMGLIVQLWGDDLRTRRTVEELEHGPGQDFLRQMDAYRDLYDIVSTRAGEDYQGILEKYDTSEKRVLAFSRILLRSVGLVIGRMGRKRTAEGRVAVWGVKNIQDAVDFLSWRFHYVDPNFQPDFSGAILKIENERRTLAVAEYSKMSQADQQLVDLRWDGDYTTFPAAVQSVGQSVWT